MDEYPPIWGFRDARECLDELIAARQRRDPSFSFRQLHRYAGIRTPNYAQLFISGKRNIREDTARKFAEGLSLSAEETEFFVALVDFTQADDPDDRTAAYRRVLELAARHGETARIDQARLDYFNEWYIPVIHAMASLKGFRPDPVWIAARVRPKIRSFDAQRALDVLVSLGILVIDDQGNAHVREPRLETDDVVRDLRIRRYHQAMIQLSRASLDEYEPGERVTSALTITVPKSLKTELMARVDGFRQELFDWLVREQVGIDGVEGDVMQVNFQAFPVTEMEQG